MVTFAGFPARGPTAHLFVQCTNFSRSPGCDFLYTPTISCTILFPSDTTARVFFTRCVYAPCFPVFLPPLLDVNIRCTRPRTAKLLASLNDSLGTYH